MLIQCTKKLLDELKIKPRLAKEELPLFSWHANLITVNRRKTVVLVNDSNRYTIILHGLKAKDFKSLTEIIVNSIRGSLLDESIKAEIVEQFINHSPEIIYTKTKDRSRVARMNKACDIVKRYDDTFTKETLNQSGDYWEHYIEVEKIIENHTQNYPTCLLGVGNAPPEDVGGIGGYAEFLEAINDPDHLEHKSMIDWGKMQRYRDFDIELRGLTPLTF